MADVSHMTRRDPAALASVRQRGQERPGAPLVLVADDDSALAGWVETLVMAGFRIARARTGFEAIVKACCHLPDVILMDLALPGLDGRETTALLKTCPATQHIPVVGVTRASEDGAARAQEAGCSQVLTACCPVDTVLEAIGRLLDDPTRA